MVSEANALYGEIMSENTETKNHLHSNCRRMPLLHIDLSYNHFSSFPLETGPSDVITNSEFEFQLFAKHQLGHQTRRCVLTPSAAALSLLEVPEPAG